MQTDLLSTLNMEDPLPLAEGLARGVMRKLRHMGYAALAEFPLSNGRRVDVIGLNAAGHTVIIEVKSSAADFRSDTKWPEYLPYCHGFYFAVTDSFPTDLLPSDYGLMIGDAFDTDVVRHPVAEHALSSHTRNAQTRRFAMIAAQRLMRAQLDQSLYEI